MEIENQEFDEERALYNSQNVVARNCRFDGPADGESAFKESREILVDHCYLIFVILSGTIQTQLLLIAK